MQAQIFKPYKGTTATFPLQIDNQNVIFFVDSIKDTSEFTMAANGKEWRLRFFTGSMFEQELRVHFDDEEVSNKSKVGRACWRDNNGEIANDAGLLMVASKFLRQTSTLTLSNSVELTSNRSLLADRDGVAYFSKDSAQFKRIVLCQSLAIAYTLVLSDCMTRMTKSVQGNLSDEALKLYENILRFNAAHYFTLPVLMERHELFAAWRVISGHYHLHVLNQEITQQLSDVAALLREQRERQAMADEKSEREDRERQRDAAVADEKSKRDEQEKQREAAKAASRVQKEREDKKDKRRIYLLSLAGIFLTATSLLALLQLTPKQFSENASAWKNWMFTIAPEQAAKPGSARG